MEGIFDNRCGWENGLLREIECDSCVLGLGERAVISRSVTREHCDGIRRGGLQSLPGGQRARQSPTLSPSHT